MIISLQDKTNLTLFEKAMVKSHLVQGGILAFPTDTVYGVGVMPGNPDMVNQLYDLKGREEDKPFILIGADRSQFIPFTERADLFEYPVLTRFWPGPLTAVLPFRNESGLVFGKQHHSTIGFRIPDYPLLLDLLSFLGFPLLSTSANKSGSEPCQDSNAIQSWFLSSGIESGIILDGGDINGIPSTVLSYTSKSDYKVIREGVITESQIASCFI